MFIHLTTQCIGQVPARDAKKKTKKLDIDERLCFTVIDKLFASIRCFQKMFSEKIVNGYLLVLRPALALQSAKKNFFPEK